MQAVTSALKHVRRKHTLKVSLCKFCDYASSLKDGKSALLGIFNRIASSKFPLALPPFHLCVELELEEGEGNANHKIDLNLIDQDGNSILRVDGNMKTPSLSMDRPTRIMQTFGFAGVPIQQPGIYRLDVIIDGSVIAEEKLFIDKKAA
jgi:hypothetical protein